MIDQHYDRYIRSDLLDHISNGCTIQQTQLVLEDDCIHRPRHEKPQTIRTGRSGCQLVTVFCQQTQLSRIAMYAQ